MVNHERPTGHAHYMVRDTAVAMAHELYDHLMHSNAWWLMWKNQNPGATPEELEELFVTRNLSGLLPQARATLAGMLRTGVDEAMKERIYEALTLDATLIRGRMN